MKEILGKKRRGCASLVRVVAEQGGSLPQPEDKGKNREL